MPQRITVDPDLLRSQAGQIDSCVLELEELLHKATKQLILIQDSVSISSRVSLMTRYHTFELMSNNLLHILSNGAVLARKCADESQNTDVSIKRSIDEIIRDDISSVRVPDLIVFDKERSVDEEKQPDKNSKQ